MVCVFCDVTASGSVPVARMTLKVIATLDYSIFVYGHELPIIPSSRNASVKMDNFIFFLDLLQKLSGVSTCTGNNDNSFIELCCVQRKGLIYGKSGNK